MKAVAALLIGLFASGYVNAGWIDKQGNTLPDSEDRKSIGNFGAQLIFTTDEAALLKKWELHTLLAVHP